MTTVRTLLYPGDRGLPRAELTAAFNAFFSNLSGYGQELNAVADEVNTNSDASTSAALLASSSKADAQASAKMVMDSISDALTAQNASEAARDATILAVSEVGVLEVARMQSYNNRNAMTYFDLNPL